MRAGLFPGQGIDPRAVCNALDRGHPRTKQASTILGYDLTRRIAQAARQDQGSLPTTLAQPGIFTAGVIAFESALAEGRSFDYLLGHSLGEYTALVAAGSIAFGQGVKLVAARARAMHRAAASGSGGMAAVLGLTQDRTQEIADANGLVVANDNSPNQSVLTGDSEGLASAARTIRGERGRSILLGVEGAFHSEAMDPAVGDLRAALESTEIRNPAIPVISNVTAGPYRAPGEIRKLLIAQLTGRVRFRECVLHLALAGVTDFEDLGPGDVVGKLARATVPARLDAVDA